MSDGSIVTYSWYRFVYQPSLQSLGLSEEVKENYQKRVEMIHANWTLDMEYLALPSSGKLLSLDGAVLVSPPKGLEKGYVPVFTRQEAGE